MSHRCSTAPHTVLVVDDGPGAARRVLHGLAAVGLPALWVDDGVAALKMIHREPAAFTGVVAGERGGAVSGLTFAGLLRDAGLTMPVLLLGGDRFGGAQCDTVRERAARLALTLLELPASLERLELVIRATFAPCLPGTPCASVAARPAAHRGTSRLCHGCVTPY
jgi:DNA-binding NtrC family response regulator